MQKRGKKILVIAIETTYSQKLEHLQLILNEIGIKANITPVKVESGIPEQPFFEDITFKESVNRDREALKKTPSADFRLKIEVGYHPNKQGNYEMFCCTSIVYKNNLIQSCFSSWFLLPEFHQNILKEGRYLGEHVREYKKDLNEPVANYIRELVRSRKPLITEATRKVLLPYLERKNC